MAKKNFQRFTMKDTELHTWFERDRQHIELRNANTEKTIIEWWDDEVSEAYEDGFLSARGDAALHVEVYNIAFDAGLLSKKAERA